MLALSAEVRWLLRIETIVVLLAGIPLFIGSEQTDRYFAWTIASPLTAAFLGALYWSAAPLVFLSSRERVWASARLAVPAVLVFAALGLVFTLLHADRFHFASPEFVARLVAWAWLAIYVIVPPLTLGLLVQQVRRPGGDPPRSKPLPRPLAVALGVQGAILFVTGAVLFAAPDAAAPRWPWALTALTARAVGAWLVALGVAAVHATWEGDLARMRVGLITYALAAALTLVALARYAGELRLDAAAFALVVLIVSMLVVALTGLRELSRASR